MITEKVLALALHGAEWVMWLLVVLSFLSIGIIVERVVSFRTARRDVRTRIMEAGRLEGDRGIEIAVTRERLTFERGLAVLATIGSNAPFLGLLGTVIGVVKAFHDLSHDVAGGPERVMSGISEALVATAVGLFVAIPAVVGYNMLVRYARALFAQVEVDARTSCGDEAPRLHEVPASSDERDRGNRRL